MPDDPQQHTPTLAFWSSGNKCHVSDGQGTTLFGCMVPEGHEADELTAIGCLLDQLDSLRTKLAEMERRESQLRERLLQTIKEWKAAASGNVFPAGTKAGINLCVFDVERAMGLPALAAAEPGGEAGHG